MSSTYPGTIDVFTNPAGTDTLDSPDHAGQHSDANDAIESMQAVMGTTAGTSVLMNFGAGEFPVKQNGSNVLQDTIANGTATAFTITSGTATTITTTSLTTGTAVIDQAVSGTAVKDEDDMASNSATSLATQQSIKAYSDSGTQTMTNKTLTNPTVNFTDKTISTNVRCDVTLSAEQSGIVATTYTKIRLDSKLIDTGNDFNTTTNTFTAPVTGVYLVSYAIRWKTAEADKRLIATIAINGSEVVNYVAETNSSAANLYPSCTATRIVSLTAADTVTLSAYHTATANQTVFKDGTFLSIYLLSI
jgi:hypothetical protein